MSHLQNPSWMCFVLICRFHSFFDVNAEPQLYCAKTHGKGRELLAWVRISAGLGTGRESFTFESPPFPSRPFASSAFISIGRPRCGLGSAITGVELDTIFDPSEESSCNSFCFGLDCLRPCLNHVSYIAHTSVCIVTQASVRADLPSSPHMKSKNKENNITSVHRKQWEQRRSQ